MKSFSSGIFIRIVSFLFQTAQFCEKVVEVSQVIFET